MQTMHNTLFAVHQVLSPNLTYANHLPFLHWQTMTIEPRLYHHYFGIWQRLYVLRLGVRATLLAKATVESCLGQGENLDTQNAFMAVIALYRESNEIPILGNNELSKRLEIVANSLAPSLVATNDYVAKEIALAF